MVRLIEKRQENCFVSILVISVIATITGCASVTNVKVDRDEISQWSCDELQTEIIRVGDVADDAEREQGLTAANLTSEVFVPFGTQVNHARAEGAERRAESALSTIYDVWDEKQCAKAIYEANKSVEQP